MFLKKREFRKSIKVSNVIVHCTMCFFCTMYILCIILLSLLTLLMVKKTVDMEAKLKSIQKEMDLLKRYIKKIRTMAEEQISKNIKMSKTVMP